MGINYLLVCERCRTKCWIGQHFASGRDVLYDAPESLDLLRAFLYSHISHPLTFAEEDSFPALPDFTLGSDPSDQSSKGENADLPKTGGLDASSEDTRVWAEQGGPIMLKAVTDAGDPVELNGREARMLAARLIRLADLINE